MTPATADTRPARIGPTLRQRKPENRAGFTWAAAHKAPSARTGARRRSIATIIGAPDAILCSPGAPSEIVRTLNFRRQANGEHGCLLGRGVDNTSAQTAEAVWRGKLSSRTRPSAKCDGSDAA